MTAASGLKRSLGFWSGTALVIGTMIGSGIFRVPGSIATVVHDPVLILGIWVFFGVVSLCGALTLSELATMMPQTGGTYVYLRAAYGDSAAFVFGWLYLLVAIPAGVAAGAVFFSELLLSTAGVLPRTGEWGIPILAISTIALLSAVNIAGVRLGAGLHNVFTIIKVGALLALIGGAFLIGKGEVARWVAAPAVGSGQSDLAAAARSVLFTYTGWIYISLVAGELRDPERRLTRIILVGTGTVILLYLFANLAYFYLIPLDAMPGMVVGREAMVLIAGPIGGTIMSVCILASIFGGLNGVILTKARVAYAQGRDGLSFSFLGRAHPTRATPYLSILIQGAGAVLLVLVLREPMYPLRLFDRLTSYFVTVEWLALIFAIAAVFVLRRKYPDARRPYKTPFYPAVPLFFVAGTVLGLGAILWSSASKGDYAPIVGLGIVAAGFPCYWLWRRSPAAAAPVPLVPPRTERDLTVSG